MQQQTTINIPSGNPVRALTGLARQIALPGEYAPERFPSFPALERTAVMAFNQPASLELPPATGVKLMVCRQASYPVWADQASVSGASYGALWAAPDPGSNANTGFAVVESKVGAVFAGNTVRIGGVPQITGAAVQSGWSRPILGRDQGTGANPFIFVPATWSSHFVLCNAVGASVGTVGANNVTVTLTYEYWVNPGEVATASIVAIIAANTCGIMTSDLSLSNAWIRPISVQYTASAGGIVDLGGITVYAHVSAGTAVYTASAANSGTVAVTGAVRTSFLPLALPTEFLNSQLPWASARTTASACLCTNVSQVLNKAGTALAGRINPVVNNPFTVTSSAISALHPAEKAWLPLETGLYTYCPPSTDMADFWDYTISTAGGYGPSVPFPTPVYRLDNDSMVNVAFMTAGSVAESLAVTISWHLEFRTSSALFQIALSGMTLETLHQAQLALAAAGFFFENPEHKSILQRVTSAVYKVAPAAMAALHAVNPMAAQAVATIHNAYKSSQSSKPKRKVVVPQSKMKMATTSARASGMLGGKPKTKRKARAASRGRR